jgi:zeta-carotene desaturase
MTAALRLLERGFHVRMYGQDDFVGGMLHSFWDDDRR